MRFEHFQGLFGEWNRTSDEHVVREGSGLNSPKTGEGSDFRAILSTAEIHAPDCRGESVRGAVPPNFGIGR